MRSATRRHPQAMNIGKTDGTYQSDTPGTFQTVTEGTFHSAMTGIFQRDTGGTSIPLLSVNLLPRLTVEHLFIPMDEV